MSEINSIHIYSLSLLSSHTQDTDFDPTAQTVTLNPGETEVCVNISITRDNIEENNETFCVDLSSNNPAVQFQPNTCQSMVTILDEISKLTISIALAIALFS